MFRLKNKSFVLAITLLTLTSCATLLEGSSQEVTFEAVGANNIMCNLKAKGGELAYKVYPPQRIWMKRSRVNMIADCYAPGNRHKQFEIVTGVEPWTATNASNGGAGVAYDAYTRAFFKYPDVVVIDMSDTIAKPELPPEYEDKDGLDPKSIGIEYMGPKTNALPDDEINAEKARRANTQYEIEQEFQKERDERKAQYDPGVKK